jgi:hypothetical protein
MVVVVPPEAFVAAVAAEADDDPVGRVLDREDVCRTKKEGGAAVLAVHREHGRPPGLEPRDHGRWC